MPAYLLQGEPFLADEKLEEIRATHELDPLAEVTLDSSASAAEILDAVGTPSLLGGSRLVTISDAEGLKKEQADALTRWLESPPEDVVLVLMAAARTKVDAAMKGAGEVVALAAPKGRKLIAWIRRRAGHHALNLDERAAWALTESVGSELRDLDAALEQLATGTGQGERITAEVVSRFFPRLADEKTYAFTDAVGERRLAPAMTALRRLLDQGEEPLVLFGSLAAHVRRLLRARSYLEMGTRAIGDAMGMPEWRAERLAKQARTFREDELLDAMEILANADIDMKGEFPSSPGALERAVIRIVTGAKA